MKWFCVVLVIVVLGLHQDLWNWTNRTLIFGILPMGLAYHALYCVIASVTMFLLVTFAWPQHLEDSVAELPDLREGEVH